MAVKTGVATKKKSMTKVEIEQTLINNFTNLQKVLTNLSFKFEELSDNISKLLQLFEISAKSFAEKYTSKEIEEHSEKQTKERKELDKEYLKKLDSLLDQNKVIAKGITLMEEKIKHRDTPPNNFHQEPESGLNRTFKPSPLPKF